MSTAFPTLEHSDPALTPPGVHFITVKSPALNRRADLTLVLPPDHESAAPLPLVTLLHGVYGSHWAWLYKGAAQVTLSRLMTEENLPPMALAMPSDGLWGDGSGYLRHRDADYAAWIVDEVPDAAATLAPGTLGAPRFLCGLSMGGYGTLRLGALNARRYTALSAHSSVTDTADLQSFILAGSDMFDLVEDAPLSALDCLASHASRLPPLRFDCGLSDPLLASNRRLHQSLLDAGVPHLYEEFPGGHDWDYWRTHLAGSLRFFASVLSLP